MTNLSKMQRTIIFFLFFFIIVLVLLFFLKQPEQEDAMPDLSSDFIKKFNIRLISSAYDSKTLMGEYEDLIVKIRAIKSTSIEDSKNYIYDKEFIINSMYGDIESPYPGLVSNKIRCGDEFKPKKIQNEPFDYYLIYSSGRFTYGSCSWDLINYMSILYYHYCSISNTLYQIELFVPLDRDISEYERHLKSLGCYT